MCVCVSKIGISIHQEIPGEAGGKECVRPLPVDSCIETCVMALCDVSAIVGGQYILRHKGDRFQ